jgi:hypothetical protein
MTMPQDFRNFNETSFDITCERVISTSFEKVLLTNLTVFVENQKYYLHGRMVQLYG